MRIELRLGLVLGLAACGNSGGSNTQSGGQDATTGGETSATGQSTDSGSGDAESSDTESGGTKFDIGDDSTGEDTGQGSTCKVVDEMDAIPECDETAPPDSFSPDVQWTWSGQDGDVDAIATPLVVNMTDDNEDGEIDLCDIPDIVVPVYGSGEFQSDGHLYVLDGETGEVLVAIEDMINGYANPAVGDIDGDGLVEIVTSIITVEPTEGYVVAFEHDGTKKWQSPHLMNVWQNAAALADLDNDGDVEIMYGNAVLDHTGELLWSAGDYNGGIDIPTAADLDGDDDLEVLHGSRAYQHDGSLYYSSAAGIGHPSVANLDDDPEPEVLISGFNGISILEHDGTPKYLLQEPTGDEHWWRPAAVHDLDGDGTPEILIGSDDHYTAYDTDLGIIWSALIDDGSGFATGTAFDFLGDGGAEAMYADEDFLYVFDDLGGSLLNSPRSSWTQVEYPVVADVDNDQSAEIVVVSNRSDEQPAVQVIRDEEDRWIQARRIWNQHAYHVTNVREDGTIPQFEPRSWELLNTYRTNAQIENGGTCKPPEG